MEQRCTCQPGRDYDGSEFGPCQFCENLADDEAERVAIIRDAARWRISQITYPRMMDDPGGYFVVRGEAVEVGIQPHPISGEKSVNACILGSGKTEGEAIDAMLQVLRRFYDTGTDMPTEIERIVALDL